MILILIIYNLTFRYLVYQDKLSNYDTLFALINGILFKFISIESNDVFILN